SRRVGGASLQVPVEVRPDRRTALAMRWLIQFSRARTEKTMAERLAAELILASKGEGNTIKKKEDTHRMAEANPAFAHYRWYAGSREGPTRPGGGWLCPPTPASPRARWPLSPSRSPFPPFSLSPFSGPVDIPQHSAIFARLRDFGPFRPPKVPVVTSGHVT